MDQAGRRYHGAMQAPMIPGNEPQRMAAVARLSILDTKSEQSFDSIVELAGTLASTPIAAFSIIDSERQWFKSSIGLDLRQTGRDISFCGHVVASDKELIVPNAREDQRFHDNPLVTDGPGIGFYAGVPVHGPDNFCIGSLCVIDQKPRQLSVAQVAGLHHLAGLIERELVLRTSSVIDSLTGLYNRGHFDQRVSEEWRRAQRPGQDFSLMLIDIDHFKKLNDSLGHQAGDDALRRVAQLLRQCTRRAGDLLARYGGEEFVIIVPNATAAVAMLLAERCRAAVEAAGLEHPGRPDALGRVTISVGLASMWPLPGESEQELIRRADQALYDAKKAGRNRVVTFEA